jgi:hypothetical protein
MSFCPLNHDSRPTTVPPRIVPGSYHGSDSISYVTGKLESRYATVVEQSSAYSNTVSKLKEGITRRQFRSILALQGRGRGRERRLSSPNQFPLITLDIFSSNTLHLGNPVARLGCDRGSKALASRRHSGWSLLQTCSSILRPIHALKRDLNNKTQVMGLISISAGPSEGV